jgi:hypothetical protein
VVGPGVTEQAQVHASRGQDEVGLASGPGSSEWWATSATSRLGHPSFLSGKAPSNGWQPVGVGMAVADVVEPGRGDQQLPIALRDGHRGIGGCGCSALRVQPAFAAAAQEDSGPVPSRRGISIHGPTPSSTSTT